MFPIPRITESFVDSIAQDLGWRRYLDAHTPSDGRLNADYLGNNAIIELKIMKEEGLDKELRQASSLYCFRKRIQMHLKLTLRLKCSRLGKSIAFDLKTLLDTSIHRRISITTPWRPHKSANCVTRMTDQLVRILKS